MPQTTPAPPSQSALSSTQLRNFLILILLAMALLTSGACASDRESNASSDSGDASDSGDDSDDPNTPDLPPYESIEVDARGFIVDGKYTILRGGTLQWFRIPEEAWDDRLRRFKAAGFNTVDMYVAWNFHERQEGVFDFETHNLRKFLDLVRSHGLYVYFRPGPYITNEIDAGGLPPWLMTRTTKKNRDADGRVNLRTNDPDYLEYVQRWFSAVNEVARPYLITNGGPIILYAIENEYDWFEIFHEVDKLFWYEGGTERGPLQSPDTRGYLEALRNMLIDDQIDVPITTCPGSGKVAGMGDVSGVIPMPNIYTQGGTETIANDIVRSMHDPERFGGAYVNYPSASTETDRTATRLKRLVMGGMDGAFHFNVVGMHQSGYNNAMVLNAGGPSSFLDFSVDNIVNAFVSPTIGYFHNVVDYYGAIGPSGTLRAKFYDFRRSNLMFDAFEEQIGAVLHPQHDDSRVELNHEQLQADYWLDAGDGLYFVGIVNETGRTQTIPIGGLHIDGTAVPRFAPMSVPATDYPGAATDGGTELEHSSIVVAGVPITDGLTLQYATSEVLTLRDHNGSPLLVVFGDEGTQGELGFRGELEVQGDAEFHDKTLVLAFGRPQLLHIQSEGQLVQVLALSRRDAGRAWFHRRGEDDYLVVGPDYVSKMQVSADGRIDLEFEHDANALDVWALAPEGIRTSSYHSDLSSPDLPDTLSMGRTRGDNAEAQPGVDTVNWIHWSGNPRPLEELGIDRGHAWYRAEFEIDGNPADRWLGWKVWVDHASDIVGIYVNGTYLTTVNPVGTEIDSRSWNGDYSFPDPTPYLVQGTNVIAFRTEIWGHGSFMSPRGTLIGSNASLPSLGFDSVKGLWGEAWVGNIQLTSWSARAQLGGERDDFASPRLDDSGWDSASLPLSLERGDVRWYRTSFQSSDLPDPALMHAPVVLALRGHNAKATIFLNSKLIGRWLSDEDWLLRGSWARPIRDMWMNTSEDHFPLPIETIEQGDNELAIVFEDVSGDSESAGRVDSLQLRYHQEVRGVINGQTVSQGKRSVRGSVSLP
jgi:hypothetical protein